MRSQKNSVRSLVLEREWWEMVVSDLWDGGRWQVPTLRPWRIFWTPNWQRCQFPVHKSPTAPCTGFTVRPTASYISDRNISIYQCQCYSTILYYLIIIHACMHIPINNVRTYRICGWWVRRKGMTRGWHRRRTWPRKGWRDPTLVGRPVSTLVIVSACTLRCNLYGGHGNRCSSSSFVN